MTLLEKYMTLTFKLDLDKAEFNQRIRYHKIKA